MKKLLRIFLFLVLLSACTTTSEPEELPLATTATEEAQPAVEPPPATESNTSTTDQATQIPAETIQMAVSDWEMTRYQDLADEFTAQNPDIKVKLISIEETLEIDPSNWQWPEDADIRLASAADVLKSGFTDDAIDQGLILDLAPFLDSDPEIALDDFYMGDEVISADGRLAALPTTINFNFIFFNKDMFDAAAVDYPQAGWNWNDFVDTARALTVREGSEVTQWGYVSPSSQGYLFLQGQAPSLFSSDGVNLRPQFDTPEVATAVQWYVDLFTAHEVSPYYPPPEPDENGIYYPQGYELVDNKQVAMWEEWSGSYSWRSQEINLGVVPMPVADTAAKTTPFYIGDGISISGGTQKPQLAWRWVKFLSSQPPDPSFNSPDGTPSTLPARRSVATASNFWDEVNPELGAALEYGLEHAYRPNFGVGFAHLEGAITSIIEDGVDVESALAEAQTAALQEFEENQVAEESEQVEIVVAENKDEALANEDAVTITFIAQGSVNGLQTYRQLARQFTEANPDIIVELREPNYNSGSQGIEDFAADADCFQGFPSFSEETLSAVLNLDPLLDVDPAISAQDFLPTTIESFRYQGQLLALPAAVRIPIMIYDKDLFDAAGVPYPQNGWTLDEFLETTVALTQGEGDNKQYGYATEPWEFSDFSLFVNRLAGQQFDNAFDPPKLVVNDPKTIAAVRWFTNLTTEYEVKPVFMTDLNDSSSSAWETRGQMVTDGRIAIWTQTFFDPFADLSNQDRNWGAVTLPVAAEQNGGSGYQYSYGYFISADTPLRQECWRWITFLTEQVADEEMLPARESVARSESYAAQVGPEIAAAYLASMDSATEPPDSLFSSEENSWQATGTVWLYQSYGRILTDGLSVEDALNEAQAKIDNYYSCMLASDDVLSRQNLVACLAETDDTLPEYYYVTNEEEE